MKNRWGIDVHKGQYVIANLPRDPHRQGSVSGYVAEIDSTSDFARAYGSQVKLHDGYTVNLDDIRFSATPHRKGLALLEKQFMQLSRKLDATRYPSDKWRELANQTGDLSSAISAIRKRLNTPAARGRFPNPKKRKAAGAARGAGSGGRVERITLHQVKVRRTNPQPRGLYVITARRKIKGKKELGARLWLTAKRKGLLRFSNSRKPLTFTSEDTAFRCARALLEAYPKLLRFQVAVEPVEVTRRKK